MKIFRYILFVLAAAVGLFVIFLAYATLDDYKPEPSESITQSDRPDWISDSARLTLLNWNIGYCGLDKSMDFFYDGGKQMRPSREGVLENLKGVVATLTAYSSFDFILLQEVDLNSKRSYRINMQEIIDRHFPSHTSYFGKNYDVDFVPIPVKEPMGKVESGLLTLTTYLPSSVERFSFPGNYSWPMGVFMLDRCFLVNRYPVSVMPSTAPTESEHEPAGTSTSTGNPELESKDSSPTEPENNQNPVTKELVLINTHNSAYDDGSLRKKQMDFLKDLLLEEFEKGNYVIVGGDWNQTPYDMKPELPNHLFDTVNLIFIEKGYPAPGWTWAFDPNTPTNRRVSVPYDPGTSLTTVIDCYLLSPNIRLEHIKTVDVGFAFSDHQPVELIIHLQ